MTWKCMISINIKFYVSCDQTPDLFKKASARSDALF